MSIDFVLDWIEQAVGAGGGCEEASGSVPLGRAAELRSLLVAASVLDDRIEARVLAHMLALDEKRLQVPLAAACARGLLVPAGLAESACYAFADGELRVAAYAAMTSAVRARLHRLAAEASGNFGPAPSMDRAARIAFHREAAGEAVEACRWWRMAGELAITEATSALAVAYLERALSVGRAGEARLPAHEELATLAILGPLMAQSKGSGSVEVAEIYARSLEIAEGLDFLEASARFDVLWGLNACILVHGRVGTARELGRKLLASAKSAGSATQIMLATRLEGLGCLLGGDPNGAIRALDNVLARYVAADHAVLRFRYASDQAAVALAHKAWAEAIAGATAGSERTSTMALEQARRLRHPHTNAHVACVLAARAMTLRQHTRLAPLATAGLTLARRHGYPYWEAWADILLGWYTAKRQPDLGAAKLDKAIAAYRGTGAAQALPMAYQLAASQALASGDREKAVELADIGLAASLAHGVVMFDAELLRVKALAIGRGAAGKALLERARQVAVSQGAGLFAQRAAAALADASRLQSSPLPTDSVRFEAGTTQS